MCRRTTLINCFLRLYQKISTENIRCADQSSSRKLATKIDFFLSNNRLHNIHINFNLSRPSIIVRWSVGKSTIWLQPCGWLSFCLSILSAKESTSAQSNVHLNVGFVRLFIIIDGHSIRAQSKPFHISVYHIHIYGLIETNPFVFTTDTMRWHKAFLLDNVNTLSSLMKR